MTVVCFYHSDLDGIASAAAVYHHNLNLGNIMDAKYIPAQYYSKFEVDPGDEIICVDITPTADVIEKWLSDGHKVTIIDHHERIYKFDSPLYTLVHDPKSQGACALVWRHFHNDVPWWVEHIGKADVWVRKDPDTVLLTRWLSIKIDLLNPLAAFGLFNNLPGIQTIRDESYAMESYETALIHSLAEKAHMVWLDLPDRPPFVLRGVCNNAARLTSSLGHAIMTSEFPTVVVYSTTAEGLQLSFRSSVGKATEIAKILGGGGHVSGATAGALLKSYIILPMKNGIVISDAAKIPTFLAGASNE